MLIRLDFDHAAIARLDGTELCDSRPGEAAQRQCAINTFKQRYACASSYLTPIKDNGDVGFRFQLRVEAALCLLHKRFDGREGGKFIRFLNADWDVHYLFASSDHRGKFGGRYLGS